MIATPLTDPSWSPYVTGAGIGILVLISFLLADHPLGCSTAYVKAAGMIGEAAKPQSIRDSPYFRLFPPEMDFALMIVPGILIGAFASAILGGTFFLSLVPPIWAARFSADPVLRLAAAFVGGVLLGFGARWAGGCTSGHGISGTAQLSLASCAAAACFFAGGIATAFLLFGLPPGGA